MGVYELAQVLVTGRRRFAEVARWFVILRASSPSSMAATQKLRTIRSE